MKKHYSTTVLLFCLLSRFALETASMAAAAPQIPHPTLLENKAVYAGEITTFTVTVTEDAPLSFQWRLDGRILDAETNKTITITTAQAADEGDYTVSASNASGQALSGPAHLFVVPHVQLPVQNFTNESGKRLPYVYVVPEDYNPSLSYSLLVGLAGAGVDEKNFLDKANFGSAVLISPESMALTSYRERVRHPTILLSPLRRAGEFTWNTDDMPLVVGMIKHLITQYSIDTNQVCLWGFSDGGRAMVTLLENYPTLFASVLLGSGNGVTTRPSRFKQVPLWVVHAKDDPLLGVSSSRDLISALRRVGGSPIYTEFASGGHLGPIGAALVTPVVLDWLLEQRPGTVTKEPFLVIESPSRENFSMIGTPTIRLAGAVEPLGERVSAVNWENITAKAKGLGSGTNTWVTAEIPLIADKTNVIIVTATISTSWAPNYGGNTTLSDTFSALYTPIRASLALDSSGAILSWTGGIGPFRVETTSSFSPAKWNEVSSEAVPPLTLNAEGAGNFLRIIGH
jgi:predicted esterase